MGQQLSLVFTSQRLRVRINRAEKGDSFLRFCVGVCPTAAVITKAATSL